jgi:hypothetical protein
MELAWFESLLHEEPIAKYSEVPFERVPILDDGLRLAVSPEWESLRLEYRNDLTTYLSFSQRNRDLEWNKYARAFRDFFESNVSPNVVKALADHGLPAALLADIGWDLVSYWQEIAYAHLRRPAFYCHLWVVYRAGHLPVSGRRAGDRLALAYIWKGV